MHEIWTDDSQRWLGFTFFDFLARYITQNHLFYTKLFRRTCTVTLVLNVLALFSVKQRRSYPTTVKYAQIINLAKQTKSCLEIAE